MRARSKSRSSVATSFIDFPFTKRRQIGGRSFGGGAFDHRLVEKFPGVDAVRVRRSLVALGHHHADFVSDFLDAEAEALPAANVLAGRHDEPDVLFRIELQMVDQRHHLARIAAKLASRTALAREREGGGIKYL